MKGFCLFFVVLLSLLLNSCAGGFWKGGSSGQSKEVVVAPPKEAERVLSCLAEHQKMSRKEFKAAYKAASVQAADGAASDTLRLICLSLHKYARYKQFKAGEEALTHYVKDHPEAAAGLQGIQMLMQRIDKEMIGKWAQSNKNLDEKGELESENKELQERNDVLEKSAEQDQLRIRELEKQIEQLKNIENIIKNRER